MTALQLFGWQTLDTGTYLKADFAILVSVWGGAGARTAGRGRRRCWGRGGSALRRLTARVPPTLPPCRRPRRPPGHHPRRSGA